MGPFPHDAPKARISAENPAGTDGFENHTNGGGTTVKHVCGVFLESGVDNDFVEMMPCRMPGVSA